MRSIFPLSPVCRMLCRLDICLKVMVLASICLTIPCHAEKRPRSEIRGIWVDGFAKGFKSAEEVDTLIRRVQAAHCNAIFAQMRKSGDAYYQSRYEPWAFDNKNHFDSLSYLIAKAHSCQPKIQVHAWINTCAVGKSHGNPYHIAIAHPDFKSLSDIGEDYDNEATKIDPGNPDAADWTFRVYLDVARKYDVDGIHFDFVRYGSTDGKGRFGYNTVSVARFNALHGRNGQPLWTDPDWMQWRRDQVTNLVRKVYVMAASVKPELTVSAATITWLDGPHETEDMTPLDFWQQKSSPMNRVFQDWRSWMSEGIIDLNCQMSYYAEGKHADWYRHWINWGKDNQFRRWDVPSSGIWLNSIEDSFQQIRAIRNPSKKGSSPAGVMLYCYAETNIDSRGETVSYNDDFYNKIGNPDHGPFKDVVEFPKLPWKVKPKFGHIQGFALEAQSLKPVDGMLVSLVGQNRSVRSDGTGYFAFVDVKPGNYKVRFSGSGYSTSLYSISVKAGKVAQMDHFPGTGVAAIVDCNSKLSRVNYEKIPDNGPIALRNAKVMMGSDVMPGRLLVRLDHGPALCIRMRTQYTLPFVTGDIVAVNAVIRTDDGGRYLDAESVALTAMEQTADEIDPKTAKGKLEAPYSLTSTIDGIVTENKKGILALDAGGKLVRVDLRDRKNTGVEEPTATWKSPGFTRLMVSGVVADGGRSGSHNFTVYPFSEGDITPMTITFSEKLSLAARRSVFPFFRDRFDSDLLVYGSNE